MKAPPVLNFSQIRALALGFLVITVFNSITYEAFVSLFLTVV